MPEPARGGAGGGGGGGGWGTAARHPFIVSADGPMY